MKKEKYFISVGEPWDFESPDGSNVINGNILSIKSNQLLLFKSNHHLKFHNNEGCILILTPRHQGNDFSQLTGELVGVNGSLLLKEYNELWSDNELHDNAEFVIVGSIRKVKHISWYFSIVDLWFSLFKRNIS